MILKKLFHLILCLYMVNCASIYLLRHGEKDINDKENVNLSLRGEVRSQALSRVFFPAFSESPFHIDGVIAMTPIGSHPSKRALQTASLIASAGNLSVIEFSRDQEDLVVAEATRFSDAGKNIIIVWNHFSLPSIAYKLLRIPHSVGGGLVWENNMYDRIWEVNTTSGEVVEICQRLLFGDSDCYSNIILKTPQHGYQPRETSDYLLAY